MKTLFGALVVLAVTVYLFFCINCITNRNSVSEEEYARMARELVEQSINHEENCR